MINLNHDKKIKSARRWFIVFLTMGIIGALNTFPSEIQGLGVFAALVGAYLGGVAAAVVQTMSELSLLWFIVAFLSRRHMNKLIREQKTSNSPHLDHKNEDHNKDSASSFMDTSGGTTIPVTQRKKNKPILILVLGVIIFIIAFAIFRYVGQKSTTTIVNNASKQELVRKIVQQTKSGKTFPNEVDSVTTWNDFLEEPNAIRYIYTVHDIDVTKLSNELLKSSTVTRLCSTSETKSGILDKDINMEYLFQVKGSTQTFFFSVTKTDCQ